MRLLARTDSGAFAAIVGALTTARSAPAQKALPVRRLGVRNMRVFGSVARGEDQPASDVDLLVDFDVYAHGAQPLIQLRRELSELLGERADVATVDLLRPEVAERALAEAVPLGGYSRPCGRSEVEAPDGIS